MDYWKCSKASIIGVYSNQDESFWVMDMNSMHNGLKDLKVSQKMLVESICECYLWLTLYCEKRLKTF